MKQITLGILETGVPPEEFREQYKSYPEMFKSLLEDSDAHINFKFFHVLEGDIPTAATECDAWLITGSKHGVYEEHQWIAPLMTLIQQAYSADIPMVGICFGHQLLAQALGGKVHKSAKGWSLGVSEYQIQQPASWMTDVPERFAIQAYHQDQVIELPENTQVIARSDFCPYAALNFNDRAISFQGHPEFAADYTAKLLISRRDLKLLPYRQSTQAIEDINKPIQRQLVAQWVCQFLRFKLDGL